MIVTLEGIDASGKATQTKRLVEQIQAEGMKAERFDFPRYQTKVGDEILSLLTQQWTVGAQTEDSFTEAKDVRALVLQALMTINRYEHFDYLKRWSEDSEGILVLDRYFASGIVYGACDGLDREFLLQIHSALPQPDAWVFVDITPEESVRRRPQRRDEYETREGFMHKVRAGYLELFDSQGPAWHVIDGHGSEDEVFDRIWSRVKGLL